MMLAGCQQLYTVVLYIVFYFNVNKPFFLNLKVPLSYSLYMLIYQTHKVPHMLASKRNT